MDGADAGLGRTRIIWADKDKEEVGDESGNE